MTENQNKNRLNRTSDRVPRKTFYRSPEILQIAFPFGQKFFTKTIGNPKSTKKIVFGGFGKYEKIKKRCAKV